MGGDHLTDDERQQWQLMGKRQRFIECSVRAVQSKLGPLPDLAPSSFETLKWLNNDDLAAAFNRVLVLRFGERP